MPTTSSETPPDSKLRQTSDDIRLIAYDVGLRVWSTVEKDGPKLWSDNIRAYRIGFIGGPTDVMDASKIFGEPVSIGDWLLLFPDGTKEVLTDEDFKNDPLLGIDPEA